MKTVKIPDLSEVEKDVPFVHFHKKESDEQVCCVKAFINVPLGATCSEPVISTDSATQTIYVTFNVTPPSPIPSDAYELIFINDVEVENVFKTENTLICVDVHVNAAQRKLAAAQADSSVIIRYRDIPG
jgi:hypothetical protein